jgi:uncharacterized protein with WD repeat
MVMSVMKGAYTREMRSSLKRNKDNLKTEYEIIAEELKSKDEKYLEYDQKRVDLFKKHVEFNADGTPVQVAPGRYKIKVGQEKTLKEENEKLDSEYFEAIEKRKAEIVEDDKWLEEEIEIKIDLFKEADLPESLNQDEYELLLNFCG